MSVPACIEGVAARVRQCRARQDPYFLYCTWKRTQIHGGFSVGGQVRIDRRQWWSRATHGSSCPWSGREWSVEEKGWIIEKMYCRVTRQVAQFCLCIRALNDLHLFSLLTQMWWSRFGFCFFDEGTSCSLYYYRQRTEGSGAGQELGK